MRKPISTRSSEIHTSMAWHVKSFRPGSETGNWGEELAAAHLRAHGCRILGRNVSPGPRLELDIIARSRDGIYLFVEVKTRAVADAWNRPVAAITRDKKRRLRKAAMAWLTAAHLLSEEPLYRFDAVEVVGRRGGPPPEIRWIKGLDMTDAIPRGSYW